jgi:ankyrin repeat protein
VHNFKPSPFLVSDIPCVSKLPLFASGRYFGYTRQKCTTPGTTPANVTFSEIAIMSWPDDNSQESHGTGVAHNVSIHQAAVSDDLAKVSDLLDGGVDINGRDESLQTALHCAIRHDSSSMVQLLLSRGVDTSLRDIGTLGSLLDTLHRRANADALRVSAKNQNMEMVQLILQRFGSKRDTDARGDYRQSALDNALLSVFDCDNADGDGGLLDDIRDQQWDHAVQIVDVLIDAGASVNTHGKSPLRCTVLHAALTEQGPPMALIISLLNHGADLNSPDSSGRSPFPQILGDPRATEELAKIFTDAGSPVDVRSNLGRTPFMQSRSASISKALLNHGADIHAATAQGTTAVHIAAASFKLGLVSFLLANGANIHGRATREDPTCGSNGRTTVLVESNTPLRLAIASVHGAFVEATLEVVTALLNHGAEVEARESTGKTSLLLAITREYDSDAKSCTHNEKVVSYLLERRADPYAVDDTGENAFQLADDRNYTLVEVGKFESKPPSPIYSHERNMGPGRGRGRGAYGRGGLHS